MVNMLNILNSQFRPVSVQTEGFMGEGCKEAVCTPSPFITIEK